MSYMDMTFCGARECTKFGECFRALNDGVLHDARQWWGGEDPPIAFFSNPKELKCYTPPGTTNNQPAGLT